MSEKHNGYLLVLIVAIAVVVSAAFANNYFVYYFWAKDKPLNSLGEKNVQKETLASPKLKIDYAWHWNYSEIGTKEKNYPIVADLSSACYQIAPSEDIAMRNAKTFAVLKKPKLSGGWLQMAIKDKSNLLDKILSDNIFDDVKNSEDFKKFFHKE